MLVKSAQNQSISSEIVNKVPTTRKRNLDDAYGLS